MIDRAVKILDHIPPYETHKIGVIYLAQGQSSEAEILANTFGSSRYLEFLRGLGTLLRLRDALPEMIYLGGLDRSGIDGSSTYYYHDNTSQVVFHVATLMPTNLTSDPKCSSKKLHIGNDFVTIVYNDSGSKYKFGTIKVTIDGLSYQMLCSMINSSLCVSSFSGPVQLCRGGDRTTAWGHELCLGTGKGGIEKFTLHEGGAPVHF